uniref:Uncharacterized protein n=1 Tax=Solanum lycopersicum TaxID=4081 RepID=A0A3Q7EEV6_SOLLC
MFYGYKVSNAPRIFVFLILDCRSYFF